MVRVLFTFLIGVLLAFAAPKGSEAACMFNCTKGKNVKIQSGSGLEGYQDIISGKEPKPFTITGKLYVPGECSPDKKLPAVIIQHGSGMPTSDWYTKLSEAFNKSGIIALVPDSHTARGITGTGRDQSQLSKADRLYDTFSAFNFLETVPCVDTSRVGITGYSFGGIIAMDSVETVLASRLAKGKTYKASLPVYPACQATFKNTRSTNTKVHLLVGELDDFTQASYCLDAVDYKKQRGWNIDITVLKGAHHGFNYAGGPKSKQSWTFNACGPIEIDENGFQIITKYGFSTKNGWKKFVGDAVKTCAKRGVTVGGTEKTAKFTLDYTIEFFTAALDVTKTSMPTKIVSSTKQNSQESSSKTIKAPCAFNCEQARKARAGYQNVNQVDAQLKIINDKSLCRNATDENGNWENIKSYKKFVDEAKDRGLDLQKCAALIRPIAKNNGASGSSSNSPLSQHNSTKFDKSSSMSLDISIEEDEIKALEKKLEALKQKAARKSEYLKLRALLAQELKDLQDQFDQKLKEVQGQIQMLEQEYKDVLN